MIITIDESFQTVFHHDFMHYIFYIIYRYDLLFIIELSRYYYWMCICNKSHYMIDIFLTVSEKTMVHLIYVLSHTNCIISLYYIYYM